MSRRKRRPSAAPEPAASRSEEPRPAGPHSSEPASSAPRSSDPRWARRLALDLGILAAIFAATVGIAELAGAANLGVAIGVGQVTFSLALVALLLRA